MGRSVLLIGATGLVGRDVLAGLVGDPGVDRVVVLSRRPLPPGLPASKVEARVADLEEGLDAVPDAAFRVDQVASALGTTIRQAGTEERFRRVDHDVPLEVFRRARAGGARHALLVSSLGADPRSRVLYSRVKGELEEAVLGLGFPSVTVLRPSLLLGDRGELRLGEEIGKRLGFLVPGRWKPVRASDVAAALVAAASEDAPGRRYVESGRIRREGGR